MNHLPGKRKKGLMINNRNPDPVRDAHYQDTTIAEVLPDIDKKIALDGQYLRFLFQESSRIPVWEKIPGKQPRPLKTDLTENKGD